MNYPTLNQSPIPGNGYNPILPMIKFFTQGDPELLAALQPVPDPEGLAEWYSALPADEQKLELSAEVDERLEAVLRLSSIAETKNPPRNTKETIADCSIPEWEFIVKPALRAWLEQRRNPDRNVPERYILTGWLEGNTEQEWSLLVPDEAGNLSLAQGTAEAMPRLSRHSLCQFHVTRDRRDAPYVLWHINTIGLTAQEAGRRRAPAYPY